MSRWKVAGIHLLLSVLVITTIATTVLMVWYPYGTHVISGVDRLFKLMLIVDVTIGPLLTAVVYRQGKSGLKMDLAVIAALQCAFLGYGLHTLWQARPVFLVATANRYDLVVASDLENGALADAPNPQWRTLSLTGPQIVGALPPANAAEREDLLFETLATGVDIDKLPRYYVPLQAVADQLLANAQPGEDSQQRAIPIVSRFDSGILIIDATTAQPIKIAKHKNN